MKKLSLRILVLCLLTVCDGQSNQSPSGQNNPSEGPLPVEKLIIAFSPYADTSTIS